MIDIENAKKVFDEYTKNYDINNGKVALKVAHILRVSELSRKIAISLNLSQEDIQLAELIGLLHDIGRFEQIKRYNTFIDSKSINHGEFGVEVLFKEGLIERFNIDKKYYKTIEIAILNHNRGKIESGLTDMQLLHCKIIRDSDKLDIFNVSLLEDTINTYECDNMQNETFSDEIVREFFEDHLINYKNRQTAGDRWISHIAFIFDYNFKNSYKIMKEKDYINRLFDKMNFKNENTIKTASEIVKYSNEYIDRHC